jgi:hypothetical protein
LYYATTKQKNEVEGEEINLDKSYATISTTRF